MPPVENVNIALTEKITLFLHPHVVWLLRNLSLEGKLCLRDDKNAAFVELHYQLPWYPSLENVTMCTHIMHKTFNLFCCLQGIDTTALTIYPLAEYMYPFLLLQFGRGGERDICNFTGKPVQAGTNVNFW